MLPAVGIELPAWPATVQAHTSSPTVGGNAVETLRDWRAIFPAMLAAIRSARRTITYEQFLYKHGAISRFLAEAFAERCRAGVTVQILIGGYGARRLPAEYRELVEAAVCQFAIFRPLKIDRSPGQVIPPASVGDPALQVSGRRCSVPAAHRRG